MDSQPNAYQVYIIRAWREESVQSGRIIVRFVLEVPETGQRRGFVNSSMLLETIGNELAQIENPSNEKTNTKCE